MIHCSQGGGVDNMKEWTCEQTAASTTHCWSYWQPTGFEMVAPALILLTLSAIAVILVWKR